MRLLDMAFASAIALWLASSGLGQDPGSAFESGFATPIGTASSLNRADVPVAFGATPLSRYGNPDRYPYWEASPLSGGVMQVAFEPGSGSPLRPAGPQDGDQLDPPSSGSPLRRIPPQAPGELNPAIQSGVGSPLRQITPPADGGVDITVRPADGEPRPQQGQLLPRQWQGQEVSPATLTWGETVDPTVGGPPPAAVQPPPGQDLPSLPKKAPETLSAATADGVLYSKEGLVYSKDGYYYLKPDPTQLPGQSSEVTRIDRNCAAYRSPNFDVVVEPLLWRLEDVRSRPLAENPVLGTTFRTSDLDLGMSVGMRTKVDYLSEEAENISGFQVVYSGIYDWNDDVTLTAPAGTYLRLPDTLGNVGETVDFATADSMATHYDARLNSVEGSLIFGQPGADFHVTVGIRYLRLEEYLKLGSFTADRLSTYEVGTRDSLWGAQIGGLWHRTRGCWELTSFLKVGVYNNDARQGTLLTDNDRTVVLRDFGTAETVNSFVMDAGLNGSRWINDRWLIRVGYGLLWMNNVARAPDQLDFSANNVSGSRIYYRQDAFAHGLNVGLEAIW